MIRRLKVLAQSLQVVTLCLPVRGDMLHVRTWVMLTAIPAITTTSPWLYI